MRVLYLIPQPKQPDRIGAYSFLDEEIQAIAAAGVEAYVLSTAAPSDIRIGAVRLVSADARRSLGNRLAAAGAMASAAGAASASHVRQPLVWYRSAWREYLAAQVTAEHRIDVIHSHFAWPTGSGGMLAKTMTGRPLVASLRGTDILVDERIGYGRRGNLLFDRSLRTMLHGAERTVYFSHYMRDHAVSLGARPEATRVIRKGVDLRRFAVAPDRGALKRELGLDARPMVLTVGGLIPRKGIDHLFEAVARLRPERDVTLVVCGDGPGRASLEAVCRQLGLGDRVVFAGRVDRDLIPRYFAACDIFALASTVEAAGNVLFEAMASGRPVVCTGAGGPQEYVADGATGFVVPVGDIAALAARIGVLLADPALQESLGREGRRRALSEFSYDRMVADLIGVYEEVLRTRTPDRVAV